MSKNKEDAFYYLDVFTDDEVSTEMQIQIWRDALEAFNEENATQFSFENVLPDFLLWLGWEREYMQ